MFEYEESRVCYANETLDWYRMPTDHNFDLAAAVAYGLLSYVVLTFFLDLYNSLMVKVPMETSRGKLRIPILPYRVRGLMPAVTTPRIKKYISRSCSSIYVTTKANNGEPRTLSYSDLLTISKRENTDSNPQEDENEYNNGGYMPISYGQELDGRYSIIRKLGYGHFSTVWLARNTVDHCYVAVKILKSSFLYASAGKEEIDILRCTMSKDRTHFGYNKILQLLDEFPTVSRNGVHECLVFEPMGPSLLHLLVQSNYQGITLPGVRNIIRQVLEGLVYLHNVCHIIHTDLKPENILIKIHQPFLQKMVDTVNMFREMNIGLPRTYVTADEWKNRKMAEGEPLDFDMDSEDMSYMIKKRYASYPSDEPSGSSGNKHSRRQIQEPIWIDPNMEIKIADLGNACFEDCHGLHNIQTKQYRALEVIIGANYSYPADLWSVGCLTFELATGEYLFNPKDFHDLGSHDDHLALIWELLDGIPPYITRSGFRSDLYFQDGKLRNIDDEKLKIWKLEDVLVEKYNWKRVDAIPFTGFVLGMIEPDPALRMTATDGLISEWLNMNDEH